jgi:hypothetical protein
MLMAGFRKKTDRELKWEAAHATEIAESMASLKNQSKGEWVDVKKQREEDKKRYIDNNKEEVNKNNGR